MLFTLQKQLQVNVLGSVRPTKVLLPDMIEKQQGRIVFISSMAGQVSLSIHCCNNVCLTYCFLSLCELYYTKIAGLYIYVLHLAGLSTCAVLPPILALVYTSCQTALYGYTAYSASKYAVRGLAEVLDMELKVHNIRVSVSFPPDTDTPMLQENNCTCMYTVIQ